MAQFYRKYKNLFLSPPPNNNPQQFSTPPLKPHPQISSITPIELLHNNKSISSPTLLRQRLQNLANSRFETQILPQLQRMNRKNQVYGALQYSLHQNRNKYKSLGKYQVQVSDHIYDNIPKPQPKLKPIFTPQAKVKNYSSANPQTQFALNQHFKHDLIWQQHRQHQQHRQYRQQSRQLQVEPVERERGEKEQREQWENRGYREYRHNRENTENRENKLREEYSRAVKTEPNVSSEDAVMNRYLPRIDHSRDGYGYPQINYGIVFSQYDRQNQYKLLNRRIKDIRWIQKYYPRGNINMYRQALLRRKDYKNQIQDRRHRLKRLFDEEKKLFQARRSIL